MKSKTGGKINDIETSNRKTIELVEIFNTPTVVLFKKTLFKDLFKIPKLSVSIIFMILLPLIVILSTHFFTETYDGSLNEYLGLIYVYYTYCLIFPIILTAVGAPIIAEELKSGTMLTLISKPISRGGILATKYLALTFFGLFINLVPLSIITLIAPTVSAFEGVGAFFVISFLFSLIIQFFFQSIAFGFSCLVKKTRNALLMPLLIIIITFFVLMMFRSMFMFMYIGESEDPIYIQFQLYHFDLGYHLFNAYIGIIEITVGEVSENMMFFLYSFGLYTQEIDFDTWEYSFTRNDFYSPLGSLILLFLIAIGLMLLGYFVFKKRDISR